jgi:hypothetical protein
VGGGVMFTSETRLKKEDEWITGRLYRKFRRSDVSIGKYISVIRNFCAVSEFPRIPTS